jgi:hypothetical protein
MSQESDGASPTPEDKKLDQLIRGSSNVELSGALLCKLQK